MFSQSQGSSGVGFLWLTDTHTLIHTCTNTNLQCEDSNNILLSVSLLISQSASTKLFFLWQLNSSAMGQWIYICRAGCNILFLYICVDLFFCFFFHCLIVSRLVIYFAGAPVFWACICSPISLLELPLRVSVALHSSWPQEKDPGTSQ